jgi:hypothetical protein
MMNLKRSKLKSNNLKRNNLKDKKNNVSFLKAVRIFFQDIDILFFISLGIGFFVCFYLFIYNPAGQVTVVVDDFEIVDKKIHIINDERKIEIVVDKKDYNSYKVLIDNKEVNLKVLNTDELLKNSRMVNSGLMDIFIRYHFKDKSDKVESISLIFFTNYKYRSINYYD